jgi:ParB family transcriptional regulator, chromosome partitioning protein
MPNSCRRFRILQKLAAEGVIDADYKVPCKIEQPEEAVETSLAENTIRAAMHPADEFVAMAALIDSGATIETVAARFGTDERHVKQRLQLGKLAPQLLNAYRARAIGLEAVTAFTLGADHAAQLAAPIHEARPRTVIPTRHNPDHGIMALMPISA